MKLIFCTLIALTGISNAFSAYNEVLEIVQISKDNSQFTFKRKGTEAPRFGITIKDPVSKQHLYDIKVLKCGPSTCLGQIRKNYSNISLRANENYIFSHNEGKSEKLRESKPVEPPKPIEPTKEAPTIPEAPVGKVYSAYLGYGSPIGGGIKAGFFRQITENVLAGPNLSMVGGETNQVNLKAKVFSFIFTSKLWNITDNLLLNFLGEFGVAKAELDFTGVDAQGPKQQETTYLVGAGGELKYKLGDFSMAGRGGFSKSGLKPDYEGPGGIYNNPYGQLLPYVELGIYYTF